MNFQSFSVLGTLHFQKLSKMANNLAKNEEIALFNFHSTYYTSGHFQNPKFKLNEKSSPITIFVEQLGRLNELREFWTSLMKRTLMGMKFVTL